jgi:hypothetical protein
MVLAFLLVFAAWGCNEESRLTVLFTGDEHGFVTPVG